MPIQTSTITTQTNGDLTLDPNGTGEVVLADEVGNGQTPLGTNNDGEVGELDTSQLPEIPTDADTGDLVMVAAKLIRRLLM